MLRALPTTSLAIVLVSFGLGGCGERTLGSQEGSSSTESTQAEASGTSGTESGGGESSESETGSASTPCDCLEGELCVADCSPGGPSIPPIQPMAHNFRCLADPVCSPGAFDTPSCREAACGSPYIPLQNKCDSDEPEGIDIRCGFYYVGPCDLIAQDCPDDHKCVAREVDEEGLYPTMCVELAGEGVHGEACEGEGDPSFSDSCDWQSQCWGGELTFEPFAGVCLDRCDPEQPSCPMGSSCEVIVGEFNLCMLD